MRVSIYQPSYLPWLPYIEKMKNSDVFVFLDTVSYSKNSFDNRNRIPINGKSYWLTIPIKTSGRLGQTYLETETVNNDWIDSHLSVIRQTYKKSKNYDQYMERIEMAYERCRGITNLATICWRMLPLFIYTFVVPSLDEIFESPGHEIVRASDYNFKGKRSELLLDICQYFKATEYYSGVMGKSYLDEEIFQRTGIKVVYPNYNPPHYYSAIHQLFTEGVKL